MADTSVSPYFDDFNPTKSFTKILAVPGRVEQAREFTQAQTLVFHYLKQFADVFFKEGAILAGMGHRAGDHAITIEAGKVYLGGKILDFPEQTVEVTGVGLEQLGVTLEETIITETEDVSLRDPAQSMANYGQAGAHRVKSVPKLTINDPDAPVIYEFEDGVLKVEPAKPQIDGLMQVLAKRTHDESGNYRVNGFDLFVEPNDANNVRLTVEAGLAYILGYQVLKPSPVKILLPISKASRGAFNEPKVYTTGVSKYALNNFPAKQINKVVGQVTRTVSMTRGGIGGGIDFLPNTAIVSVTSVVAGATTYVQGTDYILTSDGIDWSPAGAEPNNGTSYTVVYIYNKTMVQGTDYDLFQETGQWGETKDYVRFLSADKPVNSTTFTVDYDFFLARVDMVSLDKSGNVLITSGQPDLSRLVNPPTVIDPSLLKLGTVYLPPAAGNAVATGGVTTRMDMEALQAMLQRLTEVEYNQAITALDREAMDGEPPTDLKGIFSDGFQSTSKGDLTHPQFGVMYSLEDGVIMLPPNDIKDSRPIVNTATSNIHSWGRVISAPMTEKVLVNQPYATQSMLINPYLAFNTLGTLQLTPSFDNWIDTEKITIEKTQSVARNFYKWWKYASYTSRVKDLFADNVRLTNGQNVSSLRGEVGDTATAIKTEKSTQIVNEAITYMRRIEVSIKAENLIPNSDNLECFFDGVRVALSPAAGFSSGTLAGSMRANSSGVVQAKFTIPANIRTGTREVVLKNANNQALGNFTSIGTKRTITDTIFTTKITLTITDPLAQTFQFDEDRILTSVGVYFAAKDPTVNVIVQIRNVVNGYPSNVIYGEKVLKPSDITSSANSNAETKITFNDPIYCQANTQYCVVLLTDSAVPAVYIAELGQKDIATQKPVVMQPYLAGMLFSSKNGITWTAHQNQNLKFKLYVAEFALTGVVEFDPISGLNADRILLLADFLTPGNTGCVWEMRLDAGAYRPITSYEDIDLTTPVSQVQLKATFKSDKNMSPLMPIDGFTFIGFLSAQSGSYIGRNVTGFDRNIHLVKQVFDGHIPQGCTITPQFSIDDGATWRTPSLVSSTPLSIDYTQYTYELAVPNGDNARQLRTRLNINANAAVLRPKVRRFMNITK